jgi:uncharacterized protein (DUF302 family)
MSANALGITVELGKIDFGEALALATEALKAEGFGVITEIDVQATMKQKLGIDFGRYRILGACNPTIAHRALEADPMMGLLLPCNVIVFEDAEGAVTVSIANPRRMFELIDAPGLSEMVEVVYEKLARAAASVRAWNSRIP